MNIFAIINQANQNKNLTPGQRAFLKFLQGLFYLVILNVILLIGQYLSSTTGVIDWLFLLKLILWQSAFVILTALAKFFTAQGDPALGGALEELETAISAHAPAVPIAPPTPQPVAAPSNIFLSGNQPPQS